MKPWSHLANADLIDWLIASLKSDPKKWTAAYDAACDATRGEGWNAARSAAWKAATTATSVAARTATLRAVYDAARDTAWDVILALIAYDDCQQYLDMSYEQLLAWALLSERPQAVLLLPLKWVQEHEALVTST